MLQIQPQPSSSARLAFTFTIAILLFLSPMHIEASPLSLPRRELTGLPGCTTNITIPSPTEQCLAQCFTIQAIQKRCNDSYACMCQKAPPESVKSCLQCTLEASTSFAARIAPNFRHDTESKIREYSDICTLIQYSSRKGLSIDDEGDNKTDTFNVTNLPCLVQTDGLSGYPPVLYHNSFFRPLLPYMSIASALLILAVLADIRKKRRKLYS